jgi:hypothetical protein
LDRYVLRESAVDIVLTFDLDRLEDDRHRHAGSNDLGKITRTERASGTIRQVGGHGTERDG